MRGFARWTALALLGVAGCGGGGGGHGGSNAAQPTPITTATPAATVNLVLTLSASSDVAAASFNVGYEAGRGSFVGSGAQAQCQLASNDTLAVNDDDAGTLRVAMLPANPLQKQTLALPTTLTCTFAQTGGAVSTSDLRIAGKMIGVINGSGIVVAGESSRLDVQ